MTLRTTSVRLSIEGEKRLSDLAKLLSFSKKNVIEHALRELAKREGLPVQSNTEMHQ
jgi:predicted transcriptional regulator